MLIENDFTVPRSVDDVWAYLLDVEKVAPCMPGAQLTETVDDRNWKGMLKMKFGPVAMSFAGSIQSGPSQRGKDQSFGSIRRTERARQSGVQVENADWPIGQPQGQEAADSHPGGSWPEARPARIIDQVHCVQRAAFGNDLEARALVGRNLQIVQFYNERMTGCGGCHPIVSHYEDPGAVASVDTGHREIDGQLQ